ISNGVLDEIRCLDLATAIPESDVNQVRIMDLSCLPLGNNLHLITTACSDSFIRIWIYNEDDRQFHYIAASPHHARCVLKSKVLVFTHPAHSIPKVILVTASTSGHFTVWDLTIPVSSAAKEISTGTHVSQTKPRSGWRKTAGKQRVEGKMDDENVRELEAPVFEGRGNQSGVNALDVKWLHDECLIIVTGGDDNAVSIWKIGCKVSVDGVILVDDVAIGYLMNAHASNITGLKLISDTRFVTTSIDQRLKIWEFEQTEEVVDKIEYPVGNQTPRVIFNATNGTTKIEIRLVEATYIDVADVSDLDTKIW
ncbi:hypothetical protein HK096_001101, partial [Nowakowskiella sp. JEL0078]